MFKKLILICLCLCLCSCVHTRHTDDTVLEHQRQIDRTEEGKRVRDRAIEDCLRELDHIATKSDSMGGEIEDVIRQLDLYQSAIQRLLRATGYREEQEPYTDKGSDSTDSGSGGPDNN